jgi:hypothetical protein
VPNHSAFALSASRRFAALTDRLNQSVVAVEVTAVEVEFRFCFPDAKWDTCSLEVHPGRSAFGFHNVPRPRCTAKNSSWISATA